MSTVPTRPKRRVATVRFAATALMGLGVIATSTGIVQGVLSPADDAVARTIVGLASADTGRTAGTGAPSGDGKGLEAVLRNVDGKEVGWIRFTPSTGKDLLVHVHATQLTPGFHGIHIHSVGVCDPAGDKPFASAGPHLNPTNSAEGMQAGALPVLLANPDGVADTQFIDARIGLADLTGPTGSAVVVHSGSDNYANVPPRYRVGERTGPDSETRKTGDAGARTACAVLARPTAAPVPAPVPAPAPTSPHPRTPGTVPPPALAPTTTTVYGHHW